MSQEESSKMRNSRASELDVASHLADLSGKAEESQRESKDKSDDEPRPDKNEKSSSARRPLGARLEAAVKGGETSKIEVEKEQGSPASDSVGKLAESSSSSDESEEDGVPKTDKTTFPILLHAIVSDESTDDCIHWLPCGARFVISDKTKFVREVMPRFAGHSKYASFTRRLKRWSFARVRRGPHLGAYYNANFLRDKPKLASKVGYDHTASLSAGVPHAAKACVGGNGRAGGDVKPPQVSPLLSQQLGIVGGGAAAAGDREALLRQVQMMSGGVDLEAVLGQVQVLSAAGANMGVGQAPQFGDAQNLLLSAMAARGGGNMALRLVAAAAQGSGRAVRGGGMPAAASNVAVQLATADQGISQAVQRAGIPNASAVNSNVALQMSMAQRAVQQRQAQAQALAAGQMVGEAGSQVQGQGGGWSEADRAGSLALQQQLLLNTQLTMQHRQAQAQAQALAAGKMVGGAGSQVQGQGGSWSAADRAGSLALQQQLLLNIQQQQAQNVALQMSMAQHTVQQRQGQAQALAEVQSQGGSRSATDQARLLAQQQQHQLVQVLQDLVQTQILQNLHQQQGQGHQGQVALAHPGQGIANQGGQAVEDRLLAALLLERLNTSINCRRNSSSNDSKR